MGLIFTLSTPLAQKTMLTKGPRLAKFSGNALQLFHVSQCYLFLWQIRWKTQSLVQRDREVPQK